MAGWNIISSITWAGTPADMVEVGGGAGSSTVISPNFYREFGLPYDQRQNALFHAAGLKVVNHFCGGLMPMLDLVVESGADGLETMMPACLQAGDRGEDTPAPKIMFFPPFDWRLSTASPSILQGNTVRGGRACGEPKLILIPEYCAKTAQYLGEHRGLKSRGGESVPAGGLGGLGQTGHPRYPVPKPVW